MSYEATPTSAVPQVTQSTPLARFNPLAVVAFAIALATPLSVAAIITAHFAISDIKRSQERGRGLAIAALIIGYGSILLMILGTILFGTLITISINEWQHQWQQQLDSQLGDLGDLGVLDPQNP